MNSLKMLLFLLLSETIVGQDQQTSLIRNTDATRIIFAQENSSFSINVLDFDTKEKIKDVKITFYTDSDSLMYINGSNFKLLDVFNNNRVILFKLSHISYKEEIFKISELKDTFYLKSKEYKLNEVVVNNSRHNKNKFLKSIVSLFMNYEFNLSFNDRVVSYQEFKKDSIDYIEIELVDLFGTKGLKYQPFRLIIYSIDSISKKPDKELFSSEILMMKRKDKVFKYFFKDEKFQISENGFFVGIEILDEEYYNPSFVESKHGVISAVPAVKAKIYEADCVNKTYLYKEGKDLFDNRLDINEWVFLPCHLYIKINYK